MTHVTAGHRWFTWVCAREDLDPVGAFGEEVRKHFVGRLRGPFNEEDRARAGLTREFYEDLEGEGDKETSEVPNSTDADGGNAAVKVEYESK